MSYTRIQVGHLGECWVLYELAVQGIKAVKLPDYFDFDIITQRGIKIEVKTSVLNKKTFKNKRKKNNESLAWSFGNSRTFYVGTKQKDNEILISYKSEKRDRNCDFYALVCLSDTHYIMGTYIVPNAEIKDNKGICIYFNGNSKLEKYRERWDLIKLVNEHRFEGVGKLQNNENNEDTRLKTQEF